MKTTHKVLASFAALLAACIVHAADTHPARVISIQEVMTDDPAAYAVWIAKTNEVAKAKLGVETYIHVYQSAHDGQKTNAVRAVIAADSVVTLVKYRAALKDIPELMNNQEHMRAIRKLGGNVLYQGLRFDGTYKGAWVYTTTANLADEAAYLKSLDGLRAIYDANGFKDARINCYRVVAGRTDHSHRITIAFESEERMAAMLDFVSNNAEMAAWFASVAGNRKIVSNSTAHDITK